MNILFTGAAGGLARGAIDILKEFDVKLYVSVHTEKQLELAQKRYQEYPSIHCLKIDITDQIDRDKVSKIDIDVLVCNAGIGEGGSIAEIDMDRVRHNFDVNVFSNFEVIQIVLKNMIQKKKGKIVMMASLAGVIPIPFLGAYCATKASIIKMAETLRKEIKLLPVHIDIVIIEPGLYGTGFNTVMMENKYNEDEKSYFTKEIDMIRAHENIMLTLFQKKNFDTIVTKIVVAVLSDKPKHLYKAPLLQSIGAKLYMIFYS